MALRQPPRFPNHPHRSLLGHDPAAPLLGPYLGELRSQQHDHGGVVDPHQHQGERPGGAERLRPGCCGPGRARGQTCRPRTEGRSPPRPPRRRASEILASGRTLKIAPNRSEITASEPAKLIASSTGAERPEGRNRPSCVAEGGEHRAHHQRDQEDEREAQHHARSRTPASAARFLIPPLRRVGRDAPGLVQRRLELAEHAGRAEHQGDHAQDGRQRIAAGPIGVGQDGADLVWLPPAPSRSGSAPRCCPGCPGGRAPRRGWSAGGPGGAGGKRPCSRRGRPPWSGNRPRMNPLIVSFTT